MKFLSIHVIHFSHNMTQDVELSLEVLMPARCLCKAIDIRAYVLEYKAEAKSIKKVGHR